MAFITQTDLDGNSCGAFTIAYWKWLKNGRNPNNRTLAPTEDKNEIKKIYELIKFYSNAPAMALEDNCNPINMMCLLDSLINIKTTFYYKSQSVVEILYQLIRYQAQKKAKNNQQNQYSILLQLENSQIQKGMSLPLPTSGRYAIVICSVLCGAIYGGLHYILVGELSAGRYQMMNPHKGIWEPITNEQYSGTTDIEVYFDEVHGQEESPDWRSYP